jgi:hypothetical protein
MTVEGEDKRFLFYDQEGKEVVDKSPFLTDLWNYLSLKETSFLNKVSGSTEEPLDYSKILGPISTAHQDVKAVIMLLDSILSNMPPTVGCSKLAKSIADTNPIINFQAALYHESAQKLRQRAIRLKDQIFKDIQMNLIAKKYRDLGWPVEYSTRYGVWLVDYGYKARFVHFWEHIKSIEERDTFAIISPDGQLVFPSDHVCMRLTMNNKYKTPNIYSPNNESATLLAAQQSLIEMDFFESQIKPTLLELYSKAQVSTNQITVDSPSICIELKSFDETANLEPMPDLLRGIYEYLKDSANFNAQQYLSPLFK